MMLVEVIGYWWEVISTTASHEFGEFLSCVVVVRCVMLSRIISDLVHVPRS